MLETMPCHEICCIYLLHYHFRDHVPVKWRVQRVPVKWRVTSEVKGLSEVEGSSDDVLKQGTIMTKMYIHHTIPLIKIFCNLD